MYINWAASIMQNAEGQKNIDWHGLVDPGLIVGTALAAAIFLAPCAAVADDGLVSAGEFGGDAGTAGSRGGFFSGSPLSGGVSVIDHVKAGGTRLKRTTIPVDNSAGQPTDGVANSHQLPLGGRVEDGGDKFQSLFPSLDNTSSQTNLSGSAEKAKPAPVAAPKPHPVWQKSPLGGYYDASGNYREVVKGNQLWRYGGTMADGMTPAPSGPVEQNSMGYIKWQPIHGGPAGWY
jgi:hypothetical protein